MRKVIFWGIFLWCGGAFALPPYSGMDDEYYYCEWRRTLYDAEDDDYGNDQVERITYTKGAKTTATAVVYSYSTGVCAPKYVHAVLIYPTSCYTGYELVEHNISELGAHRGCDQETFNGDLGNPPCKQEPLQKFYVCQKECSDADKDNCKAMSDFVDFGTGCQRKIVTATWDATNCQCNYTYNALCKPGYYGSPNVTTCSGCQKCPDYIDPNGTVRSATSYLGATKKEQCFVATFGDSFGAGHFQPVCYWKN